LHRDVLESGSARRAGLAQGGSASIRRRRQFPFLALVVVCWKVTKSPIRKRIRCRQNVE